MLNEYLILKHICSESVYILGVGFGVLVKRTMCENRKKKTTVIMQLELTHALSSTYT